MSRPHVDVFGLCPLGHADLSDKVVFEISNVLPLLEPYHLGRGEVDRRGLVFEVKAWTLLQLRNKCVQPLAVFGRLFL